ncbi:hypothetical protein ABZ252_19625 [Streptomyces sp. NPDC006175]|uniref:hypothetical protein n=1 Tax=Streptomyces sp. NPDC006175 TaxID=3154471 RepID=UPI0033BEEC9F
MDIRVEELIDTAERLVSFTCPLGAAWGRWRGKSIPTAGIHLVEFDIPGDIGALSKAEGDAAIIGNYQSGSILIRGELESLDEDGVAGIRIATDIMLIDAPSSADHFQVGELVEFTADGIDIYPYSV